MAKKRMPIYIIYGHTRLILSTGGIGSYVPFCLVPFDNLLYIRGKKGRETSLYRQCWGVQAPIIFANRFSR